MLKSILHKDRQAECPHLGLAADESSRQPRPTAEHRCYAGIGRERVDMDHQRRFCLTSNYEKCPFLTATVTPVGTVERIEAWWRTVSPARPALTAAQLGQTAELGAAAARGAGTLLLETWRNVRPQQEALRILLQDPAAVADEETPAPTVVHDERPRVPEPRSALAWFERAKTSETLDDVIGCLEHAHKLDPDNEKYASNLESAKQRRQVPKPKMVEPSGTSAVLRQRRSRAVSPLALLQPLFALIRLSIAFVALALGSLWLFSALPAQLREPVLSASGMPSEWVLDLRGVTTLVHMQFGGGFDVGLAVPYMIGFLAVFVGVGLLPASQSPARHR